jgi:hypothetical protein
MSAEAALAIEARELSSEKRCISPQRRREISAIMAMEAANTLLNKLKFQGFDVAIDSSPGRARKKNLFLINNGITRREIRMQIKGSETVYYLRWRDSINSKGEVEGLYCGILVLVDTGVA